MWHDEGKYFCQAQAAASSGFDADIFHIHNGFRSPGKIDSHEFGKAKSEVYAARYENLRHGLSFVPKYIDENCLDDIKDLTFAFVCVDKGSSRAKIFQLLIANRIPFIDVGIGIKRKKTGLAGMARVTYYPPDQAEELLKLNLSVQIKLVKVNYENNPSCAL